MVVGVFVSIVCVGLLVIIIDLTVVWYGCWWGSFVDVAAL